jgi:hypothetical protein
MTKTKILTILGLLSLIAGCTSNPVNEKAVTTDTVAVCKQYFDFDQIDHYTIEIEDEVVWNIFEDSTSSDKEKRFVDLIMKEKPATLADTGFIDNLADFNFKKTNIPSIKFGSLKEIFCERKHKESWSSACIPTYRDIFIFKKNGRAIGVAKICFTCNMHNIIGTNCNTSEFGQSGDYDRLYEIIYGHKKVSN